MQTIIPFPGVHGAPDEQPGSDERATKLLRFPVGRVVSSAPPGPMPAPDGEGLGAAIADLPRARAMHDDIVRLITAVHRRYG